MKTSYKRIAWVGVTLLVAGLSLSNLLVPAADKQKDSTTPQLKLLRALKSDYVINHLAWHPDNRHLAVGQTLNKKITIWDTRIGKSIRTIDSEAGGVGALSYSPDGKYLVSGRTFSAHVQYHVNLYDAETIKLLHNFVPPKATKGGVNNDVNDLAISPDSHYLLVRGYGGGATAVVYNLSSGTVVAKLRPSTKVTDAIQSVAWSPNGKWIAIGRISGRLELWSTKSWKLDKQSSLRRQTISALAFSPDSQHLALGSFKREVSEAQVKEHSALPENIRRSHPLAENTPYDIVVLDVASLVTSSTLSTRHNGSAIRKLIFTPDGKYLLSGANVDSVAVHQVSNSAEVLFVKNDKTAAHPALSRDGKYVAITAAKEIKLYEFLR